MLRTKRSIEETMEHDIPASFQSVRSLRLEAIFHPKFDNEKSADESAIRKSMKQKTTGYLEVSVKHSGSLLLWSGGNRFYSKNSTDNLYSLVGELLLKQHFVRAHHPNGTTAFQECSDYLETNRITLSFEVVTSFLGDHGDRPNRDFLILTAVADRTSARFFSTAQAIEFAQRFRLPHNDYWVFQSAKAVQSIFDIYDTARETGTAKTVLPLLHQASDMYVPSMYPHDVFQGDILEGLVIRFVSSTDTDRIGKLADVARHLLTNGVPISQPDGHEITKDGPEAVNMRRLHQEAGKNNFESLLRQQMGKASKASEAVSCPHSAMAGWMTRLRGTDESTETSKIATLLYNLTNLTHHVQFKVRNGRILIVHVIHDQTFMAFERQRAPGELPLFRGFSIELSEQETDPNAMNIDMGNDEPSDEHLMLKMKFLPYMVRTFVCRNGLTTIRQGGTSAFVAFAHNLLDKWKISQSSREKWIPFFSGWGSYASMCFEGKPVDKAKDLPVLDNTNYLEHLLLFTDLYEKGEFKSVQGRATDYKGLVVVVSPVKEQTKEMVEYISEQLDGLEYVSDLTNPHIMDDALAFGRICSQEVFSGAKCLRQLAKTHPNQVAVVLYKCGENDIEQLLLPTSERKKMNGILQVFRSMAKVKMAEFDSFDFAEKLDSPMDDTLASEKLREFMSSLKDHFRSKQTDNRPGALVFFVGIPGCGKSTVVKGLDTNLQEALFGRRIVAMEGDKIKKKYWNAVKSKRIEDTAVITIADKNSPPQIWTTIAEIAAATKAIAIPVLPDQEALQTTKIQGVRYPEGEVDSSYSHYYPFSLEYLAVCMSRVMQREAGSHAGRLDSSTPRACMIVVKFFVLYRNLRAEELEDMLRDKILSANALMSSGPIRLPFSSTNAARGMPDELSALLSEAIQCQCGYDLKKEHTDKSPDNYVESLEERLRICIEQCRSHIDRLTVDVSVSSDALVKAIAATVNNSNQYVPMTPVAKKDAVTIAAIDITQSLVHNVIRSNLDSPELAEKLASICKGRTVDEVLSTPTMALECRFVVNTHVTLIHVKDIGIEGLWSTFGPSVGKKVNMVAKSIIWDNRVMALEIAFVEGAEVNTSLTNFPHITIWVAENAKAFESKNLKDLYEKGKASRVDFGSTTFELNGTVSLWPVKKTSFS